MITKEMQIIMLKNRIKKIESRPDAMKTPGVLNRLKSELKSLEKN